MLGLTMSLVIVHTKPDKPNRVFLVGNTFGCIISVKSIKNGANSGSQNVPECAPSFFCASYFYSSDLHHLSECDILIIVSIENHIQSVT